LAQQTGVSYGSSRRVLKKHLQLIPYKVTSVHELKESDIKRAEYCRWFRGILLDITFFTDEPWIHLSSYVNSQNGRVWSATNPHEIKDTPFHDQVGVWCPISRNRVIGPIFLDDTINSERYCEVILSALTEHLNVNETARGYFQQDGVTAHTARVSMTLLRDVFGNRIISKGT
jgi:hypothetical protein